MKNLGLIGKKEEQNLIVEKILGNKYDNIYWLNNITGNNSDKSFEDILYFCNDVFINFDLPGSYFNKLLKRSENIFMRYLPVWEKKDIEQYEKTLNESKTHFNFIIPEIIQIEKLNLKPPFLYISESGLIVRDLFEQIVKEIYTVVISTKSRLRNMSYNVFRTNTKEIAYFKLNIEFINGTTASITMDKSLNEEQRKIIIKENGEIQYIEIMDSITSLTNEVFTKETFQHPFRSMEIISGIAKKIKPEFNPK